MFDQLIMQVQTLKHMQPLLLNITNQVTMQWVANGLLSLGASPIMTQSMEEVEELVSIAQAITVNLGTLNPDFMQLANKACKIANDLGKPLILDPVGAGATQYRTNSCRQLLEKFHFTVIRGNASEILALNGKSLHSKGVDSIHGSEEAIESALTLSSTYQTTMAISGKTDVVVTQDCLKKIERGSSVMTRITGAGCLLTAVISAFNAIADNVHEATIQALFFYNIAGEIAVQKSADPGSFQSHFLDALSQLPQRVHYE